jgi:anaerobic selenocysteine-containing dehydrogenase
MADIATFHDKAVEPLGERKPDLYMWRELGIRLGQEEYWPFKTTKEMWSHVLEPIGITWEELMKREMPHIFPAPKFRKYADIDPKTGKARGWATPTKKIELYSTVFDKLGMDPLPSHEEPGESPFSTPELAKEYPLILTTGGRVKEFYHSEHRQIKSLRSRHPWPLLNINPDKGYEMGIADGDWVYIETPTGRCKMKAHFNAGLDPNVVHAEHSWWYPESDMTYPYLGGATDCNINAVIPTNPDYFDKRSGAFPLRALQCKVYKARESFHGQSHMPGQ